MSENKYIAVYQYMCAWASKCVYMKVCEREYVNVHVTCKCVLPAVGGWAPSAVRVSSEPPPQHELLVLLHEGTVCENHADVVGVEALRALGAADVNAALRDLDAQVLPQTVRARAMVTRHDVREAITGMAQQAEGTF